jgi:hypothetical protein
MGDGLQGDSPMIGYRAFCLLLVTICLSGCGKEGTSSATSNPTNPGRGQLLQSPPTQTGFFSDTDLLANLAGSTEGTELLQLAPSPGCTVTIYHLKYGTVGGQGEPATASGALMIPSGSSSACQGPHPIVVYAHGTSPDKTFNLADITASNSVEGLLMAVLFAGSGYIVVAPNYAGYDTSDLSYHPYLNAEQQSKDMIDCLTAAQTALGPLGASGNGKVFLTGYSQGGFVAMATHSAMQAAGMTVTASGPMSGPYALAALGDAIFGGWVNSSGPENLTLLATSYQRSYGNVYKQPTDVFEQQYASTIEGLLPSATPITTLYAQGKLPEKALFNSMAPAPQYQSITPPTAPANLAPVFAEGFGTNNLVTNAFRETALQDAAAEPDGGWPTVTTGVPAVTPMLAIRQDLKMNDLRNWVPTAPVLLCGGQNDPTVFFFNTDLMQNYWAKNAPAGAAITVLDVDSPVVTEDPYAAEKEGFAAAKATLQASSGTSGVQSGYHATLVPPFCLTAVKSFFDAH